MYLVEIAFGHCRSDGSKLPRRKIVHARKRFLEVFIQCFDGGQLHSPQGCYLTSKNSPINEPSKVIRAYVQILDDRHRQELIALSREIATILEQDSVLLTDVYLQGTMQWVKPEATVPAKLPIRTSPLTYVFRDLVVAFRSSSPGFLENQERRVRTGKEAGW